MEIKNIEEVLEVPKDYHIVSVPKLEISKAISERLKEENLSVRKLAEDIGVHHPQIVRVTSVQNYTIDTLLRVLNRLDLEIVIEKKEVPGV